MKPLKTLIMMGILSLVMVHTVSHAKDELSEDDHAKIQEVNVSICILASQGAYTAAVERQAGTSKSNAKKVLEQDLQVIQKNFSHQSFVQFVQMAWLNALDIVYEMPIQENERDKAQFISEVMEVSLVSCLDDMQA